jgi:hypothetical protein
MDAIDYAFDAVYRLGFVRDDRYLPDPDSPYGRSVADVALTLDTLLAADLAAGDLVNPNVPFIEAGTTGTGLDVTVELALANDEFASWLSTAAVDKAVRAADAMNHAIVDAVVATGAAADGVIARDEAALVADSLAGDRSLDWQALRDDFAPLLSIPAGGATLLGAQMFPLLDSLYDIGFGTAGSRLADGDGGAGALLGNAADWLDALLADELADGSLGTGDLFVM